MPIYPPTGGKIYGDTKVYPPSGGKIYPGTVYPPSLNPNWPFTDIPLPPFLWRPDLTGDYRNVGGAGAVLNLMLAPGTPAPSFSDGCILSNPSGVCTVLLTPVNPNVSSLGAVWSWIFKGIIPVGGYITSFSNTNGDQSGGGDCYLNDGSPISIDLYQDVNNSLIKQSTSSLQGGIEYTIILTFNNGDMHLYINGIEDILIDFGSNGTMTTMGDSIYGWVIGDDAAGASGYGWDPSTNGSLIQVEAIAKGVAYTPAQAAAITAGLS